MSEFRKLNISDAGGRLPTLGETGGAEGGNHEVQQGCSAGDQPKIVLFEDFVEQTCVAWIHKSAPALGSHGACYPLPVENGDALPVEVVLEQVDLGVLVEGDVGSRCLRRGGARAGPCARAGPSTAPPSSTFIGCRLSPCGAP